MEDDSLAEYRTFCAKRMRRLERCKKAKSFCSLEDEISALRLPSSSNCRSNTTELPPPELWNGSRNQSSPESNVQSVEPNWQTTADCLRWENPAEMEKLSASCKFELLRQSLISLMENDVRLLQQLLALGDSIQELKRKKQLGSQSSLNSSDLDEDLCTEAKHCRYNSPVSDVTNVFLDDREESPQNCDVYFSRKDSILRIPIAPRNSNRKCSLQRVARKASELRLSRLHPVLDGAEMNIITRSVPSCASPSPTTCNSSSARASAGSIDSGIRDAGSSSPTCSSPSPTFKDQKF